MPTSHCILASSVNKILIAFLNECIPKLAQRNLESTLGAVFSKRHLKNDGSVTSLLIVISHAVAGITKYHCGKRDLLNFHVQATLDDDVALKYELLTI